MKKILLLTLYVVFLFMMVSCSETLRWIRNDVYGAYRAPQVTNVDISTLDLATELSRFEPNKTCLRNTSDNNTFKLTSWNGTMSEDEQEQIHLQLEQKRIRDAFFEFNCNLKGNPYREQRNSIQNNILRASDVSCGEFMTTMKVKQDIINTLFSGLATIGASISPIISSPLAVAKALSASSAALMGIRTDVDQQVYGELASQLIKASIDAKRASMKKEIDNKQTYCKRNYSIQDAVRDAIDYHTACSLIAGLEQANNAVTSLKSVSMETMTKWFETYGKLKEAEVKALASPTPTPPASPAPSTTPTPPNTQGNAGTDNNSAKGANNNTAGEMTNNKAPLPQAWYNCDNEMDYQLPFPDVKNEAASKPTPTPTPTMTPSPTPKPKKKARKVTPTPAPPPTPTPALPGTPGAN
ncbi:MAG: hypothetical protein HQK97_06570 [Nitrospirae bacterium]|nr:hypothetical protein [Nitrospirota bacterium]